MEFSIKDFFSKCDQIRRKLNGCHFLCSVGYSIPRGSSNITCSKTFTLDGFKLLESSMISEKSKHSV